MRIFHRSITLAAAALATLPVCAAQAETLPVEGVYAARHDDPAEVRLLGIERFGGRAGERLAFAIEDSVRSATIGGEPWFDITLNTQGGDVFYIHDEDTGPERKATVVQQGGPDAILRGTASAEVNDTESGAKDVKTCVERDEKKKCIREDINRYECRSLEVSLRPELRMISRDGRRLYAKSDYLSASQRYCADEDGSPSVDSMLQGLIDRFAGEVRLDLVPVERREVLRVLESRKGIVKADRRAFKNAVKLTKNDPYGACLAFKAMEATNPQHVSVLFNIGLCEEGDGNLDAASDYYLRAIEIKPGEGYSAAGLDRIASRRQAEQQLAMHFGSVQ